LDYVNCITGARRRSRGARAALGALLAGAPAAPLWAAGAPFAAPAAPALPGPTGGLLRVVVSLALVLAAIVASAWLMRRLRGAGAAGGRGIEILAQAALGARERAVLVRVGGHELLLGVAAGSVRTLLVLGDTIAGASQASPAPPAGVPAPRAAGADTPPSFATALRTLLARSLKP